MGMEKNISHRSGIYKQTNKEHKHGRHRSKGSVTIANKGKVSLKLITKNKKRDLNREQRRHQASQIRQMKRDDVLAKKRSLGGLESVPILTTIVPLNKNIDPNTALSILKQCDEEAILNNTTTGGTYIILPRFKKRFEFISPPIDHEFAILDTLKVSDSVLFLISAASGIGDSDQVIDNWGHKILTASFAQGLPTPTVVLMDLESIPIKKRNDCKQNIQKLIHKWLPEEKLLTLDKNVDGLNVLRRIGNQKNKSIFFKDRRPHLLADEIQYIPDLQGTLGTLQLTGYLRGTNLSVNQLIHIPGLGDYQMIQIDAPPDPNTVDKKIKNDNVMEQDDHIIVKILEKFDSTKQESLDSENVPNPMEAEQTWPTQEEIRIATNEQKIKKNKKIPKGWSDYQASWIPDEDGEFQDDDSESENDDINDEFMEAVSEHQSNNSNEDEDIDFETVTESEIEVNNDKYDKEMNIEAEKQALLNLKNAKSDFQFPDEMDTPVDQFARIRFQKYRGLESFRTSPWDPNENLPSDYARIFQFENFDRTKKKIIKDQENKDGALVGWYITVHVKDVSQIIWSTFKETQSPVTFVGLLPYEHKMSVLNVVLKRTSNYELPIKSKEKLFFQCGFKRFTVNPIFSTHTNGQKHKFERFFQPDSIVVATFYAPIHFPPAPVLCYKEVNNKLLLVATGNLLSCNPNRLVIKRVVLSGHPLKINKKAAVIRFMFFNREDIIYFKSCKLRTRMGRTGHIKEALGTHGHMKCVFDGQLKSQDTVLLNLYKRVFPKWTYEDWIISCVNNDI